MFEKQKTEYLESNGFESFMPKAVLFDMDGVLFNSMPGHARSWHQSMAAYGIRMSEAEAYEFEGMRGVETIRVLCRRQWHREISDKEAEEMYDLKGRIFASQPEAPKIEGVERLMHTIKDGGLKISIVTGSGQHSLLDKLQDTFPGLIDKRLIVTAFDVKHGKPAPDPYLMGMDKCGVEPWQTIVIENAPLGVQAAVAARCFTIAVNTGPLPDKMLADKGANLVFKNMNQLHDNWLDIVQNCHSYDA